MHRKKRNKLKGVSATVGTRFKICNGRNKIDKINEVRNGKA